MQYHPKTMSMQVGVPKFPPHHQMPIENPLSRVASVRGIPSTGLLRTTAFQAFKPLVIVCLFLVFTISVCQPAFARRSRSRSNAAAMKARKEAAIKAAQKQYAAAQSVLSAALASGSGANARLQSVLVGLSSSANEMREALSDVKELTKDLSETEEDILLEQSAESEYVNLSHELGRVKAEMTAIEKRLLESTDFIAQRDSTKATNGAIGVVRLREEILDRDSEYPSLRLKASSLATDLTRVKHQLFEEDAEWRAIHEQLIEAQKEARARSADVYAHAPEKNQPLSAIKDAKQAAAVAYAMKSQAEAVLRSLGSSPKSSSSSSRSK